MKATVVFDFDGVIHSYKSGWQGTTIIRDEPVEGIKEAIAEIRKAGYEVVVVSTRCENYFGKLAIVEYLQEHDIEVDRVMKEKPPAIVYIDDRAICFDGKPDSLLEKIQSFQPWNKTDKKLTNFDRIKNMSVREMSEFFATNIKPGFPNSPCDICEYDEGGMYCLKKSSCMHEDKVANYGRWLESEVDTDEG